MREERRGRRTRAIRPDDRREVAERADDLPAAVRLPILDLEAVEAAALLRHCESRAVGKFPLAKSGASAIPTTLPYLAGLVGSFPSLFLSLCHTPLRFCSAARSSA